MTDPLLPADGRTLIIAEVGSNHAGDHVLALESVAAAKEAGCDMVKFQLFKPEKLVDGEFPVLKYIQGNERTQRDRFKITALPESLVVKLAEEAKRQGLGFLVTPFDDQAVEFLDPLLEVYKVASGDMTNARLLDAVAAKNKPVIISTGLSSLDEIDWAMNRFPRDLIYPLHCVAAYPTPDDQVNLSTIGFLARRYGRPAGFSDHSIGITACVAAAAMGARIIEKHFMPRDDVYVADKVLSANVAQFRQMVDEIRRVEKMIGIPEKVRPQAEEYFVGALRRSLYARTDLAAGTVLTPDMIDVLRPYRPEAASAIDFDAVMGKTLTGPVAAGAAIRMDQLG